MLWLISNCILNFSYSVSLKVRVFHFQAIFQHFLICALNDIAEQVTAEQCFSVVFEDSNRNRFMSVSFWKGSDLCKTLICRNGLPASDLTGEMGSLSRLMSAVSTKADVVAVSGCTADLVWKVDGVAGFAKVVQCCFRFERGSLARMLHKPSYSIFGRIDFFSVLQALMVSLGIPSLMIGS